MMACRLVSMEALKLEPQIFLKLSSFLDLFIANSFLIFIKSRETNISSFNAFFNFFPEALTNNLPSNLIDVLPPLACIKDKSLPNFAESSFNLKISLNIINN